ncbi:hypothetical protein F5Y10DRAFT_246736 [Nemania abortiva]|nr:hypothetical protein F5Y10DRAFT_246736 [Nemania abortiva]
METSLTLSAKSRMPYSYLKCTYCRKDKQKCEPANHQWPSKCDRCQQKGLPCSPRLKAGGNPSNESISGIQVFRPCPLPVIVQNCALAMNWLKLLWRIVREAENETWPQRLAEVVARPAYLEKLMRDVRSADAFVSSMILSALKQAVVCGDKLHETLLIRLALQGPEVHIMKEGSPGTKIAEAYSENPGSMTPFTGLESILSASANTLTESKEWVAAMDTKKELLHMILNRLTNEAEKFRQQHLRRSRDEVWEKAVETYAYYIADQQAQENLSKEVSSLVSLHRRFQSELVVLLAEVKASLTHLLPDEFFKPILHDPRFLKGPDSALVDAIASVDITYLTSADALRRTFLHLACDPPSPRAVKKMLHYGVQVNAKDWRGRTALHVACWAPGYASIHTAAEVVSLLLEHSEIDIYLKDDEGLFAAERAIGRGRFGILTNFRNCASFRADTELGQILAHAQQVHSI